MKTINKQENMTLEDKAIEFTNTLSADIGTTMQREMESMCKQLVAVGYIAGAKAETEALKAENDELRTALDETKERLRIAEKVIEEKNKNYEREI